MEREKKFRPGNGSGNSDLQPSTPFNPLSHSNPLPPSNRDRGHETGIWEREKGRRPHRLHKNQGSKGEALLPGLWANFEVTFNELPARGLLTLRRKRVAEIAGD
nr:hypothetical transcript [Hymenolepis microstoma]